MDQFVVLEQTNGQKKSSVENYRKNGFMPMMMIGHMARKNKDEIYGKGCCGMVEAGRELGRVEPGPRMRWLDVIIEAAKFKTILKYKNKNIYIL